MKVPGTALRRTLLVLLACLVVAATMALPIIVDWRSQEALLRPPVLMAATDRSAFITSPVILSSRPRLILANGRIAAPREQGARPRVQPDGKALFSTLLLDDATLILKVAAKPTAVDAAEGQDILSALLTSLSSLSFSTLHIHRGTLVIETASGARERLTQVEARIVAGRASRVMQATGHFVYRGRKTEFSARLTARSKDGIDLPLQLSLASKGLSARFVGELMALDKLRLSGDVDVDIASLKKFVHWLGVPLVGGRDLGKVTAKGRLEWKGESLTLDKAGFSMEGNAATGALTLNLGGVRPAIEGTLAFATLDAQKLLHKPTVKPSKLAVLSIRHWRERLAHSVIANFDADIRLSAERLMLPGGEIAKAAASISLKAGRLLADVAEVSLDGVDVGRLQIVLDESKRTPSLTVRGKLEGVEAKRVLALAGAPPLLAGRSTLIFDLTGTGRSWQNLAKTISGKASFGMVPGGTLSADLASLVQGLRVRPLTGWQAVPKGETRLAKTHIVMTISEGVLRAETFSLETPKHTLRGGGSLVLASGALDLAFKLDGERKPVRAAVARDVIDTLRVRGILREPMLAIEPTKPARGVRPTGNPG
ncbi:MAG: AsmA-like C-terminal region-containing protein [Hyphomicrobiaceae bacterium]